MCYKPVSGCARQQHAMSRLRTFSSSPGVIETRIISVVSWYHLAFFVISIAMFGLTARRAVFLFGRCREPCADAQPLSEYAGFAPRFRLIHAPSPHIRRSYASQ